MSKSLNGPVNTILRLSDGNYLVGGDFTAYSAERAPRIARLNADGSIDSSLSGTTTGLDDDVGLILSERDTAGNGTGKQFVAGLFGKINDVPVWGYARLNSDGSLDPTWGGLTLSAGSYWVMTMFQELGVTGLPTGKLLITGDIGTNFHGQSGPIGIARLNSDGTLDTTFNSGGTGANNIVVTARQELSAVTGLPTGNYVIGGDFGNYNGVAGPYGLIRLNSAGTPDGTFNAAGAGFNTSSWINSIAVEFAVGGLPTGKFIVAGTFTTYNGVAVGSIVRINSNGSLDATYAPGTSLVNPILVPEFDVSGKPTGKLFVAGGGYASGGVQGVLQRLNSNGTVDLSFNTGNGFDSRYDGMISTVVQEKDALGNYTGKLFVGGKFRTYNGARVPAHFIKLNSDGSLDSTYPISGSGFGGSVLSISQEYVGTSYTGKVLVAGRFLGYSGTPVPDGLAKLDSDGNLLSSFNNGGTGFGGPVYSVVEEVNALGAPTGKVVVGGGFLSFNGAPKRALTRLNSDGTLDSTFNTAGNGFDSGGSSIAKVIEERDLSGNPTGKFVVGGANTITYDGLTVPRGILRINADGSWDSTFNSGGAGITCCSVSDLLQEISAGTGLPTGKWVLVGLITGYNGGATPSNLIRINSNGSYDGTFNTGGAGYDQTKFKIIQELALTGLPTGNFLVTGNWGNLYNGLATNNQITRITATGALDNTFDHAGGFGIGNGGGGPIEAIIPELNAAGLPTGNLLVGGKFKTYDWAPVMHNFVRLKSDGTLDTSFNGGDVGTSGMVLTIVQQFDHATGLYTGNFLIGGTFAGFNTGNPVQGITLGTNTGGYNPLFFGF